LAFDAALVEGGFSLSGTSAGKPTGDGANGRKDKWDGISEVILGKKEWFDTWMEGEKKCELEQVPFPVRSPYLYLQSRRINTMRSSARLMHGLWTMRRLKK